MPAWSDYPNPNTVLTEVARRAARSVPDPLAPDPAISAALRANASNHVAPDLSEADWKLYQTQTELAAMRARVKRLESALRAAGKVLAPCASNGR